MPYWKLSQRTTAAEQIGFALSSTAVSALNDTYVKTSQTRNGCPVWQGRTTGLYLFAGGYSSWGYVSDHYYFIAAAMHDVMVSEEEDPETYDLTTTAEDFVAYHNIGDDMTMMEYPDMDFAEPSLEFLGASSAWQTEFGYGAGTSFTMTAAAATSPARPMRDPDGADEFGAPVRRSAARIWRAGVLCFQRLSSTASFGTIAAAASAWASAGGASAARLATAQTEVEDGKAYPDGYKASSCFCRWQGQVYIPAAGSWGLSYQHDDSGFARIGEAVAGASGNSTSTATATLAAGWQDLDILVSDTGGNYGSVLKLTPPGGSQAALSTFGLRCHVNMLSGSSLDHTYS